MGNVMKASAALKGVETKKAGIPRHDSDLLLEHYEPYLRKIAYQYVGEHPFLGFDDLMQDLRLVLFQCQKKYTAETDVQFHDLVGTSCMNRIASRFRVKAITADKDIARLDSNPGKANAAGRVDAYPLTRVEESEDFYRAGIFELLSTLPVEDAKVVLDHLDGSKKGPLPGSKKAFEAVKRALRGD